MIKPRFDEDMDLRHYSCCEVGKVVSREQQPLLFGKPQGLWLSIGTAWEEWCRSEDFAVNRLSLVYRVTLARHAKILRLSSASDIDWFTERYHYWPNGLADCGLDNLFLDWGKVAQEYQGVIIAPYIWERRLHSASRWYFGWDCASGVVWDAAAIGSIVKI